jgi:hypothetical protein
MDAVSGSTRLQTVWPFGVTFGPRVEASSLDIKMRQLGIRWNPDWRFLYNTHKTILGTATLHECGSAPPIYQMTPVLTEFVRTASDQEIRKFVQTMESGSDAEQNEAIEAAGDRALRPIASAKPGT